MAATICADIAAVVWLASGQRGPLATYVYNLCSALAIGQLSVVAAWLVFRRRHDLWSCLLPLGALFVTSVIRARLGFFGGFTTADYALRSALQMLVTICLLWVLMRTPLWRRLSPDSAVAKLEYSMRQLLFWMTAIAVVSVSIARSTWDDGMPVAIGPPIGIFAPASVAVGIVVFSQLKIHWFARTAGYLMVGAFVAIVLVGYRDWSGAGRIDIDFAVRLVVEFVAEALVIGAWIEWGGMINHRSKVADGTAPAVSRVAT